MSTPPQWRPPDRSPMPPPSDMNGWGRYVAATLEHILVRLHYLEQSHEELKSHSAADAPVAPTGKEPSSKDVWTERKETAKEVSVALRWLVGGILLLLLGFKKVEISEVLKLGKFFGVGA